MTVDDIHELSQMGGVKLNQLHRTCLRLLADLVEAAREDDRERLAEVLEDIESL